MDLTFKTEEGRFNYRVCAVIIHEQHLLAMQDEGFPYYYLPGGRVNFHEEAESAILREIKEELGVEAKIIRPLWLTQSFFTEDVKQEKYHELCLYYLIDISKTPLLTLGNPFTLTEGKRQHLFEWLPFEQVSKAYLYPLFIKDKILNLPKHLEIITEYQ